MPETKGSNVWNTAELQDWLRRLGAEGGSEETGKLLALALSKALLKETGAIRDIREMPERAPGWLRQKWGQAQGWQEFVPNDELESKVRHIADWIRAAVANNAAWLQNVDDKGRPKKLLKIGTLQQATVMVDEAMAVERQRLRDKFINHSDADMDASIKTVIDYGDGYRLVQLLTKEALDKESAELGHCVGNGGYDRYLEDGTRTFYSLRDAQNHSHATFEIDPAMNSLIQCKGPQNAPPGEKYFPYIKRFVEEHKFLLQEKLEHTGMVLWKDGRYYSIYSLPDDYETRYLDLSYLTRKVRIPERLKAERLSLNGTKMEDVPLPPGLSVQEVAYAWEGKNGWHRVGKPAFVLINPANGVVVEERWIENNQLHRKDEPACIMRDRETGRITKEEWHIEGQNHREDRPARLRYNEEGIVIDEWWSCRGQIHRVGKPAWVIYGLNGVVAREEWFIEGRRHRLEGAAKIIRDEDTGAVQLEEWYSNDELNRTGGPAAFDRRQGRIKEQWVRNMKLHREDGPAETIYNSETGIIVHEEWCIDGNAHRVDGPASIQRDGNTGEILLEKWQRNGKMYRPDGPASISRNPETGKIIRAAWYSEVTVTRVELYNKDGLYHAEGAAARTVYSDTPSHSGWYNPIREEWYKNGKLHNSNGPALIEFDSEGKRIREEWYEEGKCFRSKVKYKDNAQQLGLRYSNPQ